MDGRRAQELRSLEISLSPHTASSTSLVPASAGAVGQPDGAAKVDQGLSSVLVYVYGPREPVKVNRIVSQRTDKASINVEVATAPWGSTEWRHRSHGERRVVELANAIRSTFEPVLLTHQFPRSQVNMVVEVLQQDGSVLPTAINACTLALMDAGIPMIDYVTSLTCGPVRVYGAAGPERHGRAGPAVPDAGGAAAKRQGAAAAAGHPGACGPVRKHGGHSRAGRLGTARRAGGSDAGAHGAARAGDDEARRGCRGGRRDGR